MSLIKKLAGETAIYGLSSIFARALNFLLVPLYTTVFAGGEYGIFSEMYAYVGFLMVVYVLRMETAFFRFGNDKQQRNKAYSTGLNTVFLTSLLLSTIIILFNGTLGSWLKLDPSNYYLLYLMAVILFFDAINEIPFASLRLDQRPIRFATIRIINICINLGSNLFFLLLCPWIAGNDKLSGLHPIINTIWSPEIGIGYVFISNLLASLVTTLLLLPEFFKARLSIDPALWMKMFSYAAPLIIVGLAGIINEMLDRTLLKHLLPFELHENERQLGIYAACYKLAMLIALFTQAFRYAAEPFFFRNAENRKAPEIYAQVGKYFTIAGAIGFLGIMMYMDILQEIFLRRPEYREGLGVVPILLIANLFLGLYYNLSVWYKLTDKTIYAMYISLGGAAITILLNIWWIPTLGYMGSAWATLIAYGVMCLLSYIIGSKHYSLPYQWVKIGFYVGLAILIWFISEQLVDMISMTLIVKLLVNTILLGVYLITINLMERKEFRTVLRI
jgi:O-antigen/teichoic acid export membrane protein